MDIHGLSNQRTVKVNGDYIKEDEHKRLLEKIVKVSDLFIFSKELVSFLKSRATECAIMATIKATYISLRL